jgi:hypothetical protein
MITCAESLTELEVPILVPLLKMQVQELYPMKVRSMSDEARYSIGGREDSFTRLEVLKTHTLDV